MIPDSNRSFPGPVSLVLALLVSAGGCATGGASGGTGSGEAPAGADTASGAVPAAAATYADLDATLWAQTSAEYRGTALQAYRMARIQLDRALADSTWTAAPEQEEPYRAKRPAVVLDVDETVLDNSAYQARLLRRGGSFSPETWAAWVREARAPAVPGALSFTRYAHERGVRVFYVTNRDHELEEATRENLRRLGFPVDTATDVLLLRGERPGWDDKTERRALVARDHRILLLVGDNLHDFAPADQPGAYARTDRVDAAAPREGSPVPGAGHWGERWIALPNPVYGSWEDALFPDGRPSAAEERAAEKVRRLDPLAPADSAGGG